MHLDSQEDKRTIQSCGRHLNVIKVAGPIIIVLQNKIREQNSKRSELTYYRGTCYNK